MPEPITPAADAPVADDKNLAPAAPKAPLLDSSRSLNSQVGKLMSLLPDEEDAEGKPDDAKKPDDKKPEDKKPDEVKPEDKKPEDVVELDDEEEVPYVEPEALPAWQEYVLKGLPELQAIGSEGADGEQKIYNVKRAEDLPANFVFSSDRERAAFTSAIAEQSMRANKLVEDYKAETARRETVKFQQAEALEIQNDIKALQKEKVLPAFQYAENDSRFNDDPAVKEANEILELYKTTNARYYQQSQQGNGRTIYRISYRDAADKYYAQKYRNAPKEDPKPAPKAEDKKPEAKKNDAERKQAADKLGAPKGTSAENATPRRIRPGTTPQDIYRMYKNGVI